MTHAENLGGVPRYAGEATRVVAAAPKGEEACRVLVRELGVRFDERGLVPCVVQQEDTGEVLMVAWMNERSLALTLATGTTWFWSRSRRQLWNKGATSGNVQRTRRLLYDCDADTLLVLVDAAGPACHTGSRSCFFREVALGPGR